MVSMMEKQQIPAGYKQTEVGVIPEVWSVGVLNELSIISRLAGAEYTSVWKESNDGEIIALRGFNIGKNKLIERDLVRISNELSLKLKRSRLVKGDVVYPCVGTIGNAAVIEEDDKYHIQQNIARISPNAKKLSSYFLSHYLMSYLAMREVEKFTATTSQPSVLVGSLRQYQFPLPQSLQEQTAIANTLSDVDSLITALEKLIDKKTAIKTATMQQLLTGKKRLPPFDQLDAGYKQTELGDIPADWGLKSYGEVFSFLTTANNARSDLSESEAISYIHYGDIHTKWDFVVDFNKVSVPTIENSKVGNATFLKDGDVIMADASEDYQGIGKSVEVRGLGDQKAISGLHTFLLRDTNEVFIHGYRGYLHVIKSVKQSFDRLATGLKVYGLSKNNLNVVLLPVPPKAEQSAIASVLYTMDAELDALQQRLAKTQYIKQGMMQELLTGKTRLVTV